MWRVRQTATFAGWFAALRDDRAKNRIAARIVRVEAGNFGDCKPVGGGVNELRVDVGPGYRVYFTQRGGELVILLCGGDKASQQRDIARPRTLASGL